MQKSLCSKTVLKTCKLACYWSLSFLLDYFANITFASAIMETPRQESLIIESFVVISIDSTEILISPYMVFIRSGKINSRMQ